MTKTYMIFATRRSGHHPIIHWFCKQFTTSIIHFNNLYENEFKKGNIKGKGVATNFFNIYENSQPGISFLYNWEEMPSYEYDSLKESILCKGIIIPIIILRDFYNMIASSIKENKGFSLEYRKKIWIQHAKSVLLNANYINYNRWVQSSEYRSIISNKYGLMDSEEGMNDVPTFGGGSSFDKLNYQGKGTKMDVLARYEKFMNNDMFNELIDNEVNNLNKKIFGWNL